MRNGYSEILSYGIEHHVLNVKTGHFLKIFFTEKVWQNAPKDRELEGQVINCLKQNLIAKKSLTQSCSDHLTTIIEQQALHYQLDPVLVNLCDGDVCIYLKLHWHKII